MPRKIKPFQLVRYLGEPVGEFGLFNATDHFLFLGETKQVKGHGTFIRFSDRRIFINLHMDAFEPVPEDEC